MIVSVVEGRCDVNRRGGNRVNRNRHRRQHRVSLVLHGGAGVSVEALVIRVRDPMAAVVPAQNHRATERHRRAESTKNLKLFAIVFQVVNLVRTKCETCLKFRKLPMNQEEEGSRKVVKPNAGFSRGELRNSSHERSVRQSSSVKRGRSAAECQRERCKTMQVPAV